MERGEFDLIAVGRAQRSDPDWATKIRTGNAAALRGFAASDLATLAGAAARGTR